LLSAEISFLWLSTKLKQQKGSWIPAFAGMTRAKYEAEKSCHSRAGGNPVGSLIWLPPVTSALEITIFLFYSLYSYKAHQMRCLFY